jgi:chorismate mutase
MTGTSGRRPAARVVLSGAVAALVLAAPVARAPAEPAGPLAGLVDAAAQRLQVAEPVAAFKWNTGGAVEDPGRVRQELAKLGAEATAAHVDPNYVTRVFGDQINATEAIEYSRFAGWKLNPADAPAAAPDLAESRSAIDGLNHTMLTQIVAEWDLLHSPGCGPELDAARGDVAHARQLDGLYQQALSLATRSYCQG